MAARSPIFALALCLLFSLRSAAGPAQEPLQLVPEMQRPPQLLYQKRAQRAALQGLPQARRGLQRLRERVAEAWPELRRVDLAALSRAEIEPTRAWKLPAAPGSLDGQAIGADPHTGQLHLELLGPRLPARHEIVHRHLAFYAVYDPATDRLGPLIVTIRGWILE